MLCVDNSNRDGSVIIVIGIRCGIVTVKVTVIVRVTVITVIVVLTAIAFVMVII